MIIKIQKAYDIFREMILFYGVMHLVEFQQQKNFTNVADLIKAFAFNKKRSSWVNVGGQLITSSDLELMKGNIKSGRISNWHQLHGMYANLGNKYPQQKNGFALDALSEILGKQLRKLNPNEIGDLLNKCLAIKTKMVENIYTSRKKDYTNPYRKMIYDSVEEMDKVIGPLSENSFILEQQEDLKNFAATIGSLKRKFKLK